MVKNFNIVIYFFLTFTFIILFPVFSGLSPSMGQANLPPDMPGATSGPVSDNTPSVDFDGGAVTPTFLPDITPSALPEVDMTPADPLAAETANPEFLSNTPVPDPEADVTPVGGEDEDRVRVQISSDHLSGDDNTKTFDLWGNVNIKQEESLLTSDKAKFNTKTKIGEAWENVVFTRPGTTVTSEKVTVYYEEKRGIWEGNVHWVQEKTVKKNVEEQEYLEDGPVDLYCDTLEFFWEDPKKAIAVGSVKVHQKDKHAFGDRATYTEEPQQLFVENNVRLERDDGSWMTCDFLTLHVKEETVEAEGNVKGSMFVDGDTLE